MQRTCLLMPLNEGHYMWTYWPGQLTSTIAAWFGYGSTEFRWDY